MRKALIMSDKFEKYIITLETFSKKNISENLNVIFIEFHFKM